jgi:hypothetical protein
MAADNWGSAGVGLIRNTLVGVARQREHPQEQGDAHTQHPNNEGQRYCRVGTRSLVHAQNAKAGESYFDLPRVMTTSRFRTAHPAHTVPPKDGTLVWCLREGSCTARGVQCRLVCEIARWLGQRSVHSAMKCNCGLTCYCCSRMLTKITIIDTSIVEMWTQHKRCGYRCVGGRRRRVGWSGVGGRFD